MEFKDIKTEIIKVISRTKDITELSVALNKLSRDCYEFELKERGVEYLDIIERVFDLSSETSELLENMKTIKKLMKFLDMELSDENTEHNTKTQHDKTKKIKN